MVSKNNKLLLPLLSIFSSMSLTKLIYNILLNIVVWTLAAIVIYFYQNHKEIIGIAVADYIENHDLIQTNA